LVRKNNFKNNQLLGKITALKYFFVQLLSTQSDVQMAFYANKAIATVYPQIAMIKLYKNYMNIFAVSSALQLHDSFTLEAYLEDFNQEYPQTGKSAQMSESVAEFNLYNNWQTLVSMRLYLVYMSMYEGSMTSQTMFTTNTTSFLETEAKVEAQPTKQDPQTAMYMQYMYMVYFSSMIKYYCLFSEMSIPSYGSMMASAKLTGLTMLTDDTPDNDEQGRKFVSHAEYLDDVVVPSAIVQWSNLVSMRYMIEFYVLMFEMYLPNFAPARVYDRANSAMLNTNMLQTEEPKLQQN